MGFGWTRPEALAALALAVPLVLLHLYHRRKVVVPHLALLREALGTRRGHGGWRRLSEVVPLVLRLGVLMLLALALAGPRPSGADAPAEGLVLVLDGDVTTTAVEQDGATRGERQRVLAAAWVASRSWRFVSLVEARADPVVLLPPTAEASAAGAALERASRAPDPCGDGALARAVDEAVRVARRLAPARVVVVTSRPLEGAGGDIPVLVVGAGATSANQGIVGVGVARAPDGARAVVDVTVVNEAGQDARRELVVRANDQPLERLPLDLPAGQASAFTVDVAVPRGGADVLLALDGGDAFPLDDAVAVHLGAPLKPSVLLVHDGAVRPYTRAVLEAMGEGIDAQASATVRASDLARAGRFDVVVVDGVPLPPGALQPGAWLFLAPLEGELPFRVGAPLREPLVWRTAPDHPLLADVDLRSAYVARGQAVEGDGLVVLAEAEGHAVLAEGEREAVRFIVLSLEPEASDLPLRAAFPLLVRNALRRLAQPSASAFPAFLRPGDLLRPRVPLPGGPEALVRWDGASRRARLAPDGDGLLVPPGARGLVTVETAAGVVARTAFVDVSPLRQVRPVRTPAAPPAPVPSPPDVLLRWRTALLAAAALLLVLDLLVLAWRRARRPGLAPAARGA